MTILCYFNIVIVLMKNKGNMMKVNGKFFYLRDNAPESCECYKKEIQIHVQWLTRYSVKSPLDCQTIPVKNQTKVIPCIISLGLLNYALWRSYQSDIIWQYVCYRWISTDLLLGLGLFGSQKLQVFLQFCLIQSSATTQSPFSFHLSQVVSS